MAFKKKKANNDLPIIPVTLCSCLKNAKPGELPEKLLRKIEGKGKLHHCAANAYEAMDAAANAEGIDLSPTSPADTYRTLAVQEYGFYQRYTTKVIAGQKPRIYQGKAWYLKKGMAMLAVPGSSRHNLGIAIDIANANGARLEWLKKNAVSFGFSWEVVPSEPWHLRYVAGDKTPERVKQWMETNGVTSNKPVTVPKIDQDKALQQALKDKGFYDGEIDGAMGDKTKEAIKAFKVCNGLKPDFFAGPKVKELLGLK
jgi:hypothetical protein